MNTAKLNQILSRSTCLAAALCLAAICGVAHADPMDTTPVSATDADLTLFQSTDTSNYYLLSDDLNLQDDVNDDVDPTQLTDLQPDNNPIEGPIVILPVDTDPVDVSGGDVAATPEPGSLLLLGTGLAGIGGAVRRRVSLRG